MKLVEPSSWLVTYGLGRSCFILVYFFMNIPPLWAHLSIKQHLFCKIKILSFPFLIFISSWVVALSGKNIKAKPFGCSCLAALTFSPASA